MWKFFDKYGQARVQNYGAPTAGVVFKKNVAKQVVNTITETDLLNGEFTVGAGVLGTNGLLRLTVEGDSVQNSGATQSYAPRFKAKLGGNLLLDTGALGVGNADFPANASRKGWKFVVEIQALDAANVWVSLDGKFNTIVTLSGFAWRMNSLATGEGNWYFLGSTGVNHTIVHVNGGRPVPIDLTIANLLEFSTILPAANAGLDVTLRKAVVEIL